MSAGLAFAMLAASSGSAAAQQDPVTLPDAKGHIDAPKLACAQLANTCRENADFLGIWYSGWYKGLRRRPRSICRV